MLDMALTNVTEAKMKAFYKRYLHPRYRYDLKNSALEFEKIQYEH
jgi:hypothetical protein